MSDGDQESHMFSCSIDNARAVTTVLSCLSSGNRRAQHAQVDVNEGGITFVVTGKAKFTQAQGSLSKDLFQAFECRGKGGKFGINLSTLIDCLQIFGINSSASAAIVYYPSSAIFKLTIEENGIFTSCEMRTLIEDGENMGFATLAAAFRSSPEECRCILKSEYLREAFQDLADTPGAATVFVEASQSAPHFKISTSGSYGDIAIQFPRTSEAFVHFDCEVAKLRWSYALSALEAGMRALSFAQETYLRINHEGIMCIQHQVQVAGQNTFVDFLICANVKEFDGDEEENDAVSGHVEKE